MGPGSLLDMTPRARQAIETADAVVGYFRYLELIEPLLAGKETIGTGMTKEVDRCQAAIDLAAGGKNVAVISSGDAGVYGMAGLVLELAQAVSAEVRPAVSVIPGLTAAGAAASLLGAPLMNDFAVISLSDLLTPWEVIQKRVEAAAAGDFAVALYNPKSHGRVKHIAVVREIMLKHRSPATPVGIVRQASRQEQSVIISDLEKFIDQPMDMFSIVIIGNSRTYVKDGRMITPRGYEI
ncbi:MAG: precorrin-3B C(17)-methyltransferase [Sporomusaceae bacterium]|nr:precorrin-3B C(17)-methyltransferase [Sporomusaceae bacterium]